jgi:hypothetical protein
LISRFVNTELWLVNGGLKQAKMKQAKTKQAMARVNVYIRPFAVQLKGDYLMGIFVEFPPFISSAVVDRLIGPAQGLVACAATSVVPLLRDWIGLRRKPKILEIGTAILFAGLALYAILGGPVWSIVSASG